MSRKAFVVACILLAWLVTAVAAQENSLQLTLSRDNGAGFGMNIQGWFSMHVDGPTDLVRVVFLIDGKPVAEQTTPPFRYRFNTGSYPLGNHTLSAIGYTADGRELASNQLSRNFITGKEAAQRGFVTIIPIILLVVAGRFIVARIAKRGQKNQNQPAISGAFGGAICPRCYKPFARHWWGFNVVIGKYDCCPHCHKWSVVQAAPPDLLQASYEAMLQVEQSATAPQPVADDETTIRKRLDDSRFDG